ncbi:WbuC family cupin fold metalloprotein [Kaarinaea lacus]
MPNHAKIITSELISNLSAKAESLPRRRANYNVHEQLEDVVQRLYNAMEPNTYVRPHRHEGEQRWEFFQIISGSAKILIFDDQSTVLQNVQLSNFGPNIAIEIESNAWHTVVPLEPQTVLFEIKKGPYTPVTDKNFASWAPAEGADACTAFTSWFLQAEEGDNASHLQTYL